MDVSRFRSCPYCRHEPLAGQGHARRCDNCHRSLYSSPSVAVSALIVDEDEQQILLTRRAVDPFAGEWDVPGGFIQVGESLEEGLARELAEELGITVRIRRLVGSYVDTYGADATPVLAVFYVATIEGGEPVARDDVEAYRWFDRGRLPRVAFRNGREALE